MKMGKNLVIDTLEFWYHIDNQVSYRSVTYLSGSFNKKEREREKVGEGGLYQCLQHLYYYSNSFSQLPLQLERDLLRLNKQTMYQYVIIRINYRLTQRAKQIKNLGLLPFFRLSPSFIQCSKPNNILHLNKQRECEDICTPEICCMQFDDRILGGECPLPSVTCPIYSHLEPWLLFPNHQACF